MVVWEFCPVSEPQDLPSLFLTQGEDVCRSQAGQSARARMLIPVTGSLSFPFPLAGDEARGFENADLKLLKPVRPVSGFPPPLLTFSPHFLFPRCALFSPAHSQPRCLGHLSVKNERHPRPHRPRLSAFYENTDLFCSPESAA